eukprot:CAMPEP_0194293106 /NCGR_PEP_ID=MMETSP0169-20130528/47165_1 /TAXON_ID=218684 /ORGANISM="Corethron pennatum, Strain L29A3" /LENGTH=575 /DNA_ID=CAMNT_0039041505 /DNA_START=37 /DNA_END=1764 /DNA_ORIENTATION=-
MPELPEVERFRQILLPLVTPQKKHLLSFELHGEKLPRKWVSAEEIDCNTQKWFCTNVLRKGKLLCMVLENKSKKKTGSKNDTPSKKYFSLHMGMTGRLVSTTMSCSWGHKYVNENPGEDWPPKFTYLILTSGEEKVAFADPRKFGACSFSESLQDLFGELAPDGLTETITLSHRETMAAGIANQRLGIKALILDQKRVVSGVGNWVADEVLYQCEMHPDQSYLTDEQAFNVVEKLHSILAIAVDCLNQDIPYPDKWLFGFRWTKKKAGKDFKGRNLSFLVSGGRTSAIVASMQKLRRSQGKKAVGMNSNDDKKNNRKEAKKAFLEGVDEKQSGSANSAVEKKEAANEDQKSYVKSKKRKVDSKVKLEPSERPKRSRKSTVDSKIKLEPSERLKRSRKSTSIEIVSGGLSPNKMPSLVKKAAKEFKLEKEALLKQVDKSVKDDFREVGFAKWQRSWLPIIQLGPYDVSPGPVRNGWMKIFKKTNKAPRLVYWYGSPRHLSKSFSFMNENAIVSYDEGIKQNHDKLSKKITKKLSTGSKLTAAENYTVTGLAELKDESALAKEERTGWLKIENGKSA